MGQGHRRLRDIRDSFQNTARAPAREAVGGAMHDYKIYVLDRQEHIVLAYDFRGPDDSSALEESKRHTDKTALEVWQGARFVARIAQGAKSATG